MRDEINLKDIPAFTPDMPFAEKRKIWIEVSPNLDEAAFDALMAKNKARQVNIPEVGEQAPDFELDTLDRDRGRTGNKLRLSSLRGKPVGLFFGSYT